MIFTFVKTQQISRTQALELFEEKNLLQWFQIHSFQKENEDLERDEIQGLNCFSTPISLPKILNVPVAFANFQEQEWFKFIEIPEGKPLSLTLQEFLAIQLGVALRNNLKKTQIPIGNKNQEAVQKAQQYYEHIQKCV